MKTKFFTILCITFFLFSPLIVNAHELKAKISSNHTSTGIYYEIFEADTNFTINSTRNVGDSITVTREFLYYDILVPPAQIDYCEIVNNISYEGVLMLSHFYFDNGKTLAVYTGTLTVVHE